MTIRADINRHNDSVDANTAATEKLHALLQPFVMAVLAKLADADGATVRMTFDIDLRKAKPPGAQ